MADQDRERVPRAASEAGRGASGETPPQPAPENAGNKDATIRDEPVVACSECGSPEGRPVDPDFVCRRCRHADSRARELEDAQPRNGTAS